MTTTTEGTSRTAHLLALMKKGDDAFNARDFAAVDEVHHPDMVAYIPGLAEPVEFGQTTKWEGDQLIVISAFYDAAVQRQQIGLAQ
jgi:hypothetical protein